MSQSPAAAGPAPRRRRLLLWASLIAGVLLLLAVGLRIALQPERVTRLALDQVGHALGLEITAQGIGEYHLRGTPTLVIRGLAARQPGAAVPVLVADRVFLSLPWSTLRARGRELDFTRIELDAPVLDLQALQDWRASRPAGETRIPTLREGLAVRAGSLVARGWSLESLDIDLPSLHPGRKVRFTTTGRYRNGETTLPFDLAVVLTEPADRAALGIAGKATLQRPRWTIPAWVKLGGRLQLGGEQPGEGGWGIAAMTLAADARYQASAPDSPPMPFRLGLAAPLRMAGGRLTLVPLGVAIRVAPADAGNLIPPLAGHGALVQEQALGLDLAGVIDRWPEAWPQLPAPLGESQAPLPFVLDYLGPADLSGITRLQLQRDASRFDGRFHLPDIQDWMEEDGRLSPLPPLEGTASVPRMELAGATLHGVEITVDSGEVTPPAPAGQPAGGNLPDGD